MESAEQPKENATNLVAPAPANKTEMVAKPAPKKAEPKKTKTKAGASTSKPKTVKIRALTAIAIGKDVFEAGQEVEVTEEQAVEFCDRKFKGNYAFSGERDTRDATFRTIVRAERCA